jgi:hypothetical protein
MTNSILDAFEDGIYIMNQNLFVEYMNSAMIADFGDGEVIEDNLSAATIYDAKGKEIASVESFVDLRNRLKMYGLYRAALIDPGKFRL